MALPAESVHIYTVTEVTRLIRSRIEQIPPLWVVGEVSNVRRHTSGGHLYFTLKDEKAELSCVMWGRVVGRLGFEIKDGLRLVCYGELSVYERRGQYEFIVRTAEPRGIGALALRFEQLKRKLAEEGLFEEGRKKAIPNFPVWVAVVTSPVGAAVRDVVRTIRKNFRGIRISIYPSLVQGEEAPGQIARAIEALNRHGGFSVIVLARGGGSLEDLWAFNEEEVARAIYASEIPVISAVGHEVDYTISDYVSDARAATPTAAGQMLVRGWAEAVENLPKLWRRVLLAVRRRLERMRALIEQLRRRRVLREPAGMLAGKRRLLDEAVRHLVKDARRVVENTRARLSRLAAKLEATSPLKVLARGYSITHRADDNRPLKNPKDAPPGTLIVTRLAEGHLHSRVVRKGEKKNSQLQLF